MSSYRLPAAPCFIVNAAGERIHFKDAIVTPTDPEIISILEGMVKVGNATKISAQAPAIPPKQ